MMTSVSQLFRPYRVLGLINDELPVAFQSRASAFYITSSIGSSFHIYDVSVLGWLWSTNCTCRRYFIDFWFIVSQVEFTLYRSNL